jgi:hypothetical protein
MPHSVAQINAAIIIKAREPLDDRQCAEHKGREDHKEEKIGRRPMRLCDRFFLPVMPQNKT